MTRTVKLERETPGISPEGRGTNVPAGTYEVAELDGTSANHVYLLDPEKPELILAIVQASATKGTDR